MKEKVSWIQIATTHAICKYLEVNKTSEYAKKIAMWVEKWNMTFWVRVAIQQKIETEKFRYYIDRDEPLRHNVI